MPQFQYTAKDQQGKTLQGIVESGDSKTALEMIRAKGLITLSLKEASKKSSFSVASLFPKSNKVAIDDIVVFSRQLSTVVEAGIPLVNALDIISEQMDKPELKARIGKIKDDVEAGAAFSEAIAKDKEFFSSFFVNMVKAGESSGTLDEILERLAVYIEKSSNLQKKVKSAMIYPAVVMGMAVTITLVLIIKVIPVFKDIYSGFGSALPGPTQMLMDLSDFLRKYFYVVFIFIGLTIMGLKKVIATPKGRRAFDNFKLKAPVFGPLIKKVAISKFTRTFATLVKSGVPILNSLDIVGKTADNIIIEEAVEKVKTNVKQGENIAGPLAKIGIFPPMVVRMISIGEKTGELEKMLTKVSDFYDEQVKTAVDGLTSLIEPLVIAFLGIVIGGIVICMFLPILQLSSVVKF